MIKQILFFTFFISISVHLTYAQQSDTGIALKEKEFIYKKTNLTRYLDAKKWNALFPKRYGIGLKDTIHNNPDFYSFESFVKAAKLFPEFLSGKSDRMAKKELAAFLANIAQETSGGWENAEGSYFKWGMYFLEEINDSNFSYNDTTKKKYPGVEGRFYYGRGPKQLTWNYNYGQFSEAWYGSKDTLLLHPEYLSEDPVLAFASALWFWMTPQFPKPSCHDIITGKWIPTQNDIEKGRLPGFGAIVNIINGGVECGTGADILKTQYRYKYYQYFCNYFHVDAGENINCSNQKPFGQ